MVGQQDDAVPGHSATGGEQIARGRAAARRGGHHPRPGVGHDRGEAGTGRTRKHPDPRHLTLAGGAQQAVRPARAGRLRRSTAQPGDPQPLRPAEGIGGLHGGPGVGGVHVHRRDAIVPGHQDAVAHRAEGGAQVLARRPGHVADDVHHLIALPGFGRSARRGTDRQVGMARARRTDGTGSARDAVARPRAGDLAGHRPPGERLVQRGVGEP
jgi:hypothetical protein